MRKKIYTMLLLAFVGIMLEYTTCAAEQVNKDNITPSMQKCRLAASDFLDPVMSTASTETATELKKIQTTIFDFLTVGDIDENTITTKKKTSSCDINYSMLVKAVQGFLPEIQPEQLDRNFRELLSIVPSKATRKDPFLFLINLRNEIKKVHLSNTCQKAEPCTTCKNPWTQRSKISGDIVRECLFCGHDEVLSYHEEPIIITMPIPKISGRAVEWLFDPAEDIYVKVCLNETDPEAAVDNKGKGAPIMLSNVIKLSSVGTKAPEKKASGAKRSEEKITHVVLLEEGSHIEFLIKVNKPGECGFGFSVTTDYEKIADKLYVTDTEGKNDTLTASLRRYGDKEKTIKVDLFKTLDLDKERPTEKIKYTHCTVQCREIESFEKNNTKYPQPRRENSSISASEKGPTIYEQGVSVSELGKTGKVIDGDDIGSLRIVFYIFANTFKKNTFYKVYKDLQGDDF